MLHHSAILLHKDRFSRVTNSYVKSVYYSIYDEYGVNADEAWINGNRFYITIHEVFRDGGKATKRSTPDNLT